jgi:hypothetical protein
MPNDFLSSLTSRALQASEVGSSAGGLSPRLASRFEIPAGQALPDANQELDTEEIIEAQTQQERGMRKTTAAPGPDQPETQDIGPTRSEQGALTAMMHAEHRPEEARGFLQSAPVPALIIHSQPILDAFPSDAPRARVRPASTARVENSNPSGELSVNPPKNASMALSETGLRSHTGFMDPVPSQTMASARERLSPSPVLESKTVMPAAVPPAAQPVHERKVIPERIEITRVEPSLQTTDNSPQIVPAVALPDLKLQRSVPEAPELPPTIQVTIGRIEVKAATSGQAQKHRTSASQTMSLEEYLRRRQGGDR